MKIRSIGGGPAGLFTALLLKQALPKSDIRVFERNRPDDTFGFGVVFSDATLGNIAEADPDTYREIESHFARWDEIDTYIGGERVRSTGHGFCGLERHELLAILQRRCAALGIEIEYETELASVADVGDADLILAADGVASGIRDELAAYFEPDIDYRPNRFVWLGTTVPFEAFTFYFKEDDAGLWRVHAYRYKDEGSTFIVETTEAAWRASGMHEASEDETVAYLENLFAKELAGHKLIKNRSIWRQFPTIKNRCWHHGNVVLLGDAAHTAHFSIGSGTKLAMEDGIALCSAVLEEPNIKQALAKYEEIRRPDVESLQRAAQSSLEWFEGTERYMKMAPKQFTYSMLTRSLRVTHDNLAVRDPEFISDYNRFFAAESSSDAVVPLFAPLALRELEATNRIAVAPSRLDSAVDGVPGDDYLVHAAARATGGAAIVFLGEAAVTGPGRLTRRTPAIYREDQAEAWQRIVSFVRGRSDSLTGLRLSHSGPRGGVERPWPGEDMPIVDAWELFAASSVPYGGPWNAPSPATSEHLVEIVDAYREAVERADRAGLHVVELDFAGGGFVASFISPLTNQREDAYGGPIENRVRLACEIVASARSALSETKPLFVRLCADDCKPGGIRGEEAVRAAAALVEAGADVITVTSGYTVDGAPPSDQRGYSLPMADRIRQEAGVRVMAEGGIWSADDACTAIASGRADLCSLERAALFDPSFARRAAARYGIELPWRDCYFRARGFRPR